jgi:hypothetical protein
MLYAPAVAPADVVVQDDANRPAGFFGSAAGALIVKLLRLHFAQLKDELISVQRKVANS